MNEFLTFITSGTIESFEPKTKEKYIYLSQIFYYSLALLFLIFIVYEIVLYTKWGVLGVTIVGQVNDIIDEKQHLLILLQVLVMPLLAGFSLWWCLTLFNYRKVALSVSLILSFVVYKIAPVENIVSQAETFAGYNLIKHLSFLLSVGVFYLIFINIANKKLVEKAKAIWNKNLQTISYVYIALFILYMLSFIKLNIINIVACIIISVFLGCLFIYIRRLLGYSFAVILHYALLLPVILVMSYMYINQ